MYKAHTEEYKGCTIEVWNDEYVESPDDWGNDDVCFWNREITVKNDNITKEIFGAYIKHPDFDEYKKEAKEVAKKYWIFGVDAYIHSGIALSLHGTGYRCKWDTSDYVGCIIVAKKEARLSKEAERIAKGILETWNDYLSGNVYGFTSTDPLTGEMIGSCGGFYGDYDKSGLLDDARLEVDHYLETSRKTAIAKKIEGLKQEQERLQAEL
jgi:hypothetical protein